MAIPHAAPLIVSTILASSASLSAQAAVEWAPADPPMLTRWAAEIDPAAPLPEYPRPQLTRDDWLNLNGLWHYAVTKVGADQPDQHDGRILVPFAIESSLSGVKRVFLPDEVLWYERTFTVPADWGNRRIMLHFGAVDYRADVFVNGQRVGTHQGGYDPFHLDITDALDGAGEQALVVKVTDPTWAEGTPRGKQTLDPGGIMYTPTSGIWQTVWLEPVAAGGIDDLTIVPDVEAGQVRVRVDTLGDAANRTVRVTVRDGDATIAEGAGSAGKAVVLDLPDATLWSPDNPHLYDLDIALIDANRNVVDEVGSYFGMRSVGVAEVEGVKRLTLNGEPLFMFGPLDQGFWPDAGYTAPTDAALRYDLEVTKQLGFNMTRKHIKVEPARWYFHADQLGVLVWQDMPSINSYDANKVPGGVPEIDAEAFETELRAMIDHLENHPSIAMWVIFNENQGEHRTEALAELVRELDPTRLVNAGSGGRVDHAGGDVHDEHPYPAPRLFEHDGSRVFVLGEYGGIGLPFGDNNPWQAGAWGYTTVADGESLEDRYAEYGEIIRSFKEEHALGAAVYTQITDVEIEINGLLTYDRQLKVDPAWIAKATNFQWSGPYYTDAVATSQERGQTWKYTFDKPADNWTTRDFDDADWQSGLAPFGDEGAKRHLPVRTEWTGDHIWLRREFNLYGLYEQDLDHLVVTSTHDDAMKVYINGVLAVDEPGARHTYEARSIRPEARAAIELGGINVLAVVCEETGGDQQIDVGLLVRRPNRDE